MKDGRSFLSRGVGPALAAVGLIALTAAILAPSSSGTAKVPVSIQGVQNMIAMSGSPTAPRGEKMECAGEMRGSPVGEGVFHMSSIFHGPQGTATWTFYNRSGTLRGTTSTIAAPGPSGLVANGTFTITDGTGAYKGATGSGTIQSIQPKDTMITNFTLSGIEFH